MNLGKHGLTFLHAIEIKPRYSNTLVLNAVRNSWGKNRVQGLAQLQLWCMVYSNNMLVAVPQETWEAILAKQDEILALLKTNGQAAGSAYLTEKEAMQLLGRKATWFWQQRTSGRLAYSKIGNKIYYAKADIEALLDANRIEAFRNKHS